MWVIVLASLALLVLFVSALVWRTRTKTAATPRAVESAAAAAPERSSVLARGVVVEGTIRSSDPLRIDGDFRGTIDADAPLSIGAPGHVTGDVRARELVVAGEIDGDIDAQRLALRGTARVTGDIDCAAISVENGAWFHGRVTMKRDEAAEETHATA